MLTYPQLSSGALAQFPVRKRRRKRTVTNELADNSFLKLSDPGVEVVEWHLEYAGLSDTEAGALEEFFAATEGNLEGFTFLDPCANLFSWSEDLANTAWAKAPFISITIAGVEPLGGGTGWQVINSGAGAQRISQTLAVPGGYVYSLSVFARASEELALSMFIGSKSTDRLVTAEWRRISISCRADTATESVEFGIELPAGGSVEICGLQVEPQPAPSAYKPSRRAGVYEGATFRDDTLSVTSTDVNRHSATVDIIYADRL